MANSRVGKVLHATRLIEGLRNHVANKLVVLVQNTLWPPLIGLFLTFFKGSRIHKKKTPQLRGAKPTFKETQPRKGY